MDLPDLVAPDILLKTRRSAYVPAGFLRLAGRDLIAGGTDVTTVAGLLGHAQPSILTDAETFIYAYRLGAKIMMDVLVDGEINEI